MKSGSHHLIKNGPVKLHLETLGQGPRNLLLVHGWISSHRMWHPLADLFDPTLMTLHLLDLRGAGHSDRPTSHHQFEDYASDVIAALRWIEKPLTLVGHSAGGKLAQYVALEAKAFQIESLILIAPGTASSYPENSLHRARMLETYGRRERIQSFQKAAMARPISAALSEILIEDALRAQKEFWTGWYDHGRSRDFSDRLSEIRIPTLVIAGEKDTLNPPSRMKLEVIDRIPDCTGHTIPGAGHNLPIEAPEEIHQLIMKFL